MRPLTKYTPKYLQLLFQSTTPPKEEARLLHGTLKRAPKRIHYYYYYYYYYPSNILVWGMGYGDHQSVC